MLSDSLDTVRLVNNSLPGAWAEGEPYHRERNDQRSTRYRGRVRLVAMPFEGRIVIEGTGPHVRA